MLYLTQQCCEALLLFHFRVEDIEPHEGEIISARLFIYMWQGRYFLWLVFLLIHNKLS